MSAPSRARILVVEDEENFRKIVEFELARRGHVVSGVPDGEGALAALKGTEVDLVLLDLKMPGIGGMETLRRIRAEPGAPEVVLMTAYASVETAIEASRNGALGYVKKPIDYAELDVLLERVRERRRTLRQADALHQVLERASVFPDFVGESPPIRSLVATIRKVGPADCAVLIEGETGTGKELVARSLHRCSHRSGMPFVSVNCASLPEPLLESELFGHERGAFTGAIARKRGLLEVADGGTLFLDEIGEMGGAIQAKFLRVLEDGELRRVGANANLHVNVRIVAATHRDMDALVAARTFREDLYYRLNTVVLRTPSLRERKDDIPALVAYFLQRLPGARGRRVSPEAMALLQTHGWPGNVRELRNTVERFVILADGDVVEPRHLPLDAFPERSVPAGDSASLSLADVERRHILRVLEAQQGNKTRAAQVLGITKSTLYAKLRDYGVSVGKDTRVIHLPPGGIAGAADDAGA